MLQRREYMSRSERERFTLKAAHRRDAELADQIRVLAIGFLESAPARIARHIHDGSEHHLCAACPDLARGNGEHAREQRRVPGARERDGLREIRGSARGVAVQTFLVEEDRDSQPRVVDSIALDRIDQRDGLTLVPKGCLERAAGSLQIIGAREVADAGRVQAASLGGIELTLRIEELALLRPDRSDLRNLLLEGHARQEIFDPLFDRRRGIFIDGALWWRRRRKSARDRGHEQHRNPRLICLYAEQVLHSYPLDTGTVIITTNQNLSALGQATAPRGGGISAAHVAQLTNLNQQLSSAFLRRPG